MNEPTAYEEPESVVGAVEAPISDEEAHRLRDLAEADQLKAKADAAEKELNGQILNYNAHREQTYSPPNRVQCPLEGYTDIYVTYDLTQQYFRRSSQPAFKSSLTRDPKTGKVPDLWDNMELMREDFDRWIRRKASWASAFIKEVEGWPEDITDAQGNEIINPAYGGKESMYALLHAHPELAEWIAETGYDAAMVASVKNSRGR